MGWTVEKESASRVRLRTSQPRTEWVFDLAPGSLQISTTTTDGLLTATAPAAKDRFPARLLDKQGAPVTWSGTREVANGYDGAETRNPSYLPQRNAEVMYFSLGQISADGLHSLFDRKTDTAVSFSNETKLHRTAQSADVLAVSMPVPGHAAIQVVEDYYKSVLGAPYYGPFDDSNFPKAPMVWSSWTSYYAEVTEKDIVRNADWLAENLKPYGFQYVQLDDGYDRGKNGEHYWIENWDKAQFPHGPEWLTQYIKSKGLKAGIWLVPNAYAGAVETHPDWYVRDKRGKLILDYKTPTLDSSNPEVFSFLRKLFTTLDNWGFEYYKFDGEHAFSKYVPAVDRSKLHDPSVDPLATYRERLKLIRSVVGPKTFIEGCPAGTPLNGIQYFNSYFNGDDVYNSWQGMYPLFSSINANAFLNHILVYVMPGEGIDVGTPLSPEQAKQKRNATFLEVATTREKPLRGFGTTLAEAHTLVTYVALTGVVYPLASVMPELPEERIRLLKMSLPTLPIYPVDLFSRGTDMQWDKFKHVQADFYIHNYPDVLDLKVNAEAGAYDVVGLTNWRSEPLHKRLSFSEKLGLSPAKSYVVFDYWNQKSLGTFRDGIELDIDPHDTRVLFIRPVLPRPQLIGISRHITGSYSLSNLTWNDAEATLAGGAEPVPGEPYRLTFSVPDGLKVAAVKVLGRQGGDIQTVQEKGPNTLSISFPGQQEPVRWSVQFARSRR